MNTDDLDEMDRDERTAAVAGLLQRTTVRPTRPVDLAAIRRSASRRRRRATSVGAAAVVILVAGLVAATTAGDTRSLLLDVDEGPTAMSPDSSQGPSPTTMPDGDDGDPAPAPGDTTATTEDTAMAPYPPETSPSTTSGVDADPDAPPPPDQDPAVAVDDGRVELLTWDSHIEGGPANDLEGTIHGDADLDGGCLWVVFHKPQYGDKILSVRWPHGSTARFFSDAEGTATFELYDVDGNVVARDGDRLSFSGSSAGHREAMLPRCNVSGDAPWYIWLNSVIS